MTSAAGTVSINAYAKINLGLDVTGIREDGYHLVRMIMQTIGLHDTITVTENASGFTCYLRGDADRVSQIPQDASNLCIKAALAMQRAFPDIKGATIELTKRIPVAAGLAGGSTDAAAVIVGLNEIYDLGASSDELCSIGTGVGADVPYCILQGTCLAEGIGELLTPIHPMPACHVLIAKPPVGVSTPWCYKTLDGLGAYTHPDIDALIGAIESESLEGISGAAGNVLELATIPAHPEIDAIKQIMAESGAVLSMMSGSGPTAFGLFADPDAMRAAADRVQKSGLAQDVICTDIMNEKRILG